MYYFGIFFDSCIAMRDKQIDMRCCLSEASSSNDYENRTCGLRAQDVFALFLLVRFSFWDRKKMNNPFKIA